MLYAHNQDETKKLFVVEDNEPQDPRTSTDNLGKLICWHRNYMLGDKHVYDDPIDLLKNLLRHINDNGRSIIRYLKSGGRGAKLTYNKKTHEWDLWESYCYRTVLGDTERKWEVTSSAPKSQLRCDGWFFDDMLESLTINDCIDLLKDRKDIVIMPLYLYDHSGLSMSTSSFVGRAVHADWDSGQVGFIYADHDAMKAWYGDHVPNREEIVKELTAEVETYDDYLRGNVYGFVLYENGEQVDSCWGFYGDGGIQAIKEYVDSQLVDTLEYVSGDIEDYA